MLIRNSEKNFVAPNKNLWFCISDTNYSLSFIDFLFRPLFSFYNSYISVMKSAFTAISCALKSVALYNIGVRFICVRTLWVSTENLTWFPGLTTELKSKFNIFLKVSLSLLRTVWMLCSIKNKSNLWQVFLFAKDFFLPYF